MLAALALVPAGKAVASESAFDAGDQGPKQDRGADFGEEVLVRTGFVRIVLPKKVPTLPPQDVEVSWKGRPQKVTRVLGGSEAPVELGIALDLSVSIQPEIGRMRSAALAFVTRWEPLAERLFLTGFADRVRVEADGPRDVRSALETAGVGSGASRKTTAFFAALRHGLDRFENTVPRAALIVVSDACNTSSFQQGPARISDRSRELAVPLLILVPERRGCTPVTCKRARSGELRCVPTAPPTFEGRGGWAEATWDRDFLFRKVGGTGGVVYFLDEAGGWGPIWEGISDRLERQWMVVYEAEDERVRSDEVAVTVRFGDERVTVRE